MSSPWSARPCSPTARVARRSGLLAARWDRWDDELGPLGDAPAVRSARRRLPRRRVRDGVAASGRRRGSWRRNVFRRDGDTGRSPSVAARAVALREAACATRGPAAAPGTGSGGHRTESPGSPRRRPRPGRDGRMTRSRRPGHADGYRTRLTGSMRNGPGRNRTRTSSVCPAGAERDALRDELTYAAGWVGGAGAWEEVTEASPPNVPADPRCHGRVERIHPEPGTHLRASIRDGARAPPAGRGPCGGASHPVRPISRHQGTMVRSS